MQIGSVIRKYRKECGLTQEEMAKRLGVTTPAVNKWENGNTNPDIELLAPIALEPSCGACCRRVYPERDSDGISYPESK